MNLNYFRDTSKRKTLQLLQESEAKYKLIVDSVKDYAIFMLDLEGYIITWNSGAERLSGYKEEEVINQHFSIFYPKKALNRNHPEFELEVAKKEGRFEEEGWRIRKDGSRFWANVVISAVYNKKKKIIGFSKITRDLTESKNLRDKLIEANEELRKSEERARLLIAGVKDYAIFMLTPAGKIASWNEGAKTIKGYQEDEIIGQHFSIFYTAKAVADQYPQFELKKALEDGRFEDEGWRIKKDGSKFWANVVITPMYDANQHLLGYTKITRDLTERVRNEELMKKNEALQRVNTDLDNFIYTASHDLKSPIANLDGLVTLMKAEIAPNLVETQQQIISMASVCIDRLNATIANLVEVTKVQKNQDDKSEVISIPEVLAEVKMDLATESVAANVEITQVLQVDQLYFAKANLRSILYNLLSNALKYRSAERPLKISIHAYMEEEVPVITITDNGLGVTKEQEVKLFSLFKRFHTHVKGSGVGLYIVKRTLENHGGKIEVNSTLNEGTEFKLYFKA